MSETLDVIRFAQIIGFKTIISHRSGDSEDTFIADLAVGTNSNQIKAIFKDIDEKGNAVIETDIGEEIITSGEISIKGVY